MTVRINKPALNLREELTKAQGVVRYEQRQFWMDGIFADYFNSSGWSTSNATVTGTDNLLISFSSGGYVYKGFKTEKNKKYSINVTYTGDAPSLTVSNNGVNGSARYISGYVSGTNALFTSSQTTMYLGFARPNGSTTITGVFISEVDENDNVIHSVPLGFKPVHVYEDGLLQREGENHDYTVVKTGGAYAIKPAVQPTATTETCIIAEREL